MEPNNASPEYSRKSAWSWALYDAANSAFPLVITTAVFVLYFKGVVVGGDSIGRGDLLWGISISVSALLVAVTSPIIGAAADARNNRKAFLLAYTGVAVVATLALGRSGPGTVIWSMTFFILANAAFEGGMVFYGSLLPFVAPRDKHGRWSGVGWACGYLGGLVCLLIVRGFAEDGRIGLVTTIVAAWFALLSVPLFVNVRESGRRTVASVSQTLAGLREALRLVARTRGLRRFFIAYFLYNDAIITVFSFAAPFATDELGYSLRQVIMLVLAVQVTGAIGAFGLGMLADRIGNARTILVTLAIWIGVTLAAFATALELPLWEATTDAAATRRHVFFAVGLCVGFAMGATQSASRSFLASSIPESMSGRFFGFYAVAGRFSAVVGPFLFGAVSFVTGSKAWSVLALALLFGVGYLLVRGVDEDDIRRQLRAPTGATPQ